MAVPNITPGFTVLSTCDATTGWIGSNTVDSEVLKQGVAGLSAITRSNGLNQKYLTVAATNMVDTHIRIWFNFASIGFLADQIAGGIRIMVYDGVNTGYWYVGGKDTYGGGWTLLTVSTARPFDEGSCNLSAVTRVGFALSLTGSPRNAVNTWWDYLVMGNGITITGGTSSDPVRLVDIYNADNAAGYGAVQRLNGVYFVSTNLVFGSTSNIYFEDTNQIIVFENQPVDANLYKIESVGTGITSWKLTNSVLKSANTATRFDLLLNDSGLDTTAFSGNTIVNADWVRYKTGQSITNCVFQSCNQIITGGASFEENTVAGSTDALGALLWPNDTSVKNCAFNSNTRAIQMASAGTYSFIGITLAGNTTDINNTSGGAIVVNVSGGGTASGVTSIGTVSVQSSATLTLTGVVDASEVRIYEAGTINELFGVESKSTGVNPSYSYTTVQQVDIVIHSVSHQYFRINNYTLQSSDTSLPVSQIFDRNYSNP